MLRKDALPPKSRENLTGIPEKNNQLSTKKQKHSAKERKHRDHSHEGGNRGMGGRHRHAATTPPPPRRKV